MNAMSFIPASSVASNVLSLSEAAAKVLETKQSGVRVALNQLERLETERKQWECDELESARQSLYAMLTVLQLLLDHEDAHGRRGSRSAQAGTDGILGGEGTGAVTG